MKTRILSQLFKKKEVSTRPTVSIHMEDVEKYDFLITKTQYPLGYLVRLGREKVARLYDFYRAQEDALYLIENKETLSQWPLPWQEERFSYFIQRTVSYSAAAVLFYISNLHEGLPLEHIFHLYAPLMK